MILFGSVARGDSDEYSDYDVLVLFEDGETLHAGWDLLFERVGELTLSIQAVPETIDEFKGANPVFVDELEKHGKVLFARWPFELRLGSPWKGRFSLISYDLSALAPKDKMRVLYHMYEEGGDGQVARGGGFKLSSGCVLLPEGEGSSLAKFLEVNGVKTFRLNILLDKKELRLLEASSKAQDRVHR